MQSLGRFSLYDYSELRVALEEIAVLCSCHAVEEGLTQRGMFCLQALGHFSLYDYREPRAVPEELKGAFSVVVADPPYLVRPCILQKHPHLQWIMSSDRTEPARTCSLAAQGKPGCKDSENVCDETQSQTYMTMVRDMKGICNHAL